MIWTEVMGLIGSSLSSLTFMPQVVQTWRTKSVADLNLNMLLIVSFSTVAWLIYGFSRELLPVIISNSIILVLSLILLYFKLSFSKKK